MVHGTVTVFWKYRMKWPTRHIKCVPQMFKLKFMAHIILYYLRRQLKEQRHLLIGKMPCTIRLSTAHQSISKNDQNAWFINRQLLGIKFQNIIIERPRAHMMMEPQSNEPNNSCQFLVNCQRRSRFIAFRWIAGRHRSHTRSFRDHCTNAQSHQHLNCSTVTHVFGVDISASHRASRSHKNLKSFIFVSNETLWFIWAPLMSSIRSPCSMHLLLGAM